MLHTFSLGFLCLVASASGYTTQTLQPEGDIETRLSGVLAAGSAKPACCVKAATCASSRDKCIEAICGKDDPSLDRYGYPQPSQSNNCRANCGYPDRRNWQYPGMYPTRPTLEWNELCYETACSPCHSAHCTDPRDGASYRGECLDAPSPSPPPPSLPPSPPPPPSLPPSPPPFPPSPSLPPPPSYPSDYIDEGVSRSYSCGAGTACLCEDTRSELNSAGSWRSCRDKKANYNPVVRSKHGGPDKVHTMTIDLGAPKHVKGIASQGRAPGQDICTLHSGYFQQRHRQCGQGYVRQFTVATSVDGTTYTPVQGGCA